MSHNLEKPLKNFENSRNSAGETSFLIVKDIKDLLANKRAKHNENIQFSLSFYNLEAMEQENSNKTHHINAVYDETLGISHIKGSSSVEFLSFFFYDNFYQVFV